MSYKENRKLCLIFLVFFIYPAISILHFYLTNVLPACLTQIYGYIGWCYCTMGPLNQPNTDKKNSSFCCGNRKKQHILYLLSLVLLHTCFIRLFS